MRLIFGLVLLAGLGLAGFAVHMAQGYIGAYRTALQQERAASAGKVATTGVFVAARPIRYGEPLTQEDVRTVGWPSNAVPEGAFQDAAALFPEGEEARVVLRAMEAGEAILAVKVTEPGQDAGVSSRISAGMRAFAIRVDVTRLRLSPPRRPGRRLLDRPQRRRRRHQADPDGRAHRRHRPVGRRGPQRSNREPSPSRPTRRRSRGWRRRNRRAASRSP